MELWILGGMVVIAVTMIAYALMPGKHAEDETVQRRTAGLGKDQDPREIQAKARKSAAANSMFAKAAPLLSRPVMPKNAKGQSTLRAKLASAGMRTESAASLFLASKMVGAAVGGIAGSLLAIDGDQEMLIVVGWTIFAAGLG